MSEQKYIDDLREIKEIMNRSSRFISLSGLSGVAAGIFALGGAYAAYQLIYADQNYLGYRSATLNTQTITSLLLIALITITLTIGAGIFFTTRKARKENQQIWDLQTQRLLINLAIPLVAGGVLCLILLFKGFIGLIAPLTLLFYGLALVNASKYTYSEIRSLGIVEIILGLLGTYLIGYGLILWAIGFGLLHIIYGIIMQIKYGS